MEAVKAKLPCFNKTKSEPAEESKTDHQEYDGLKYLASCCGRKLYQELPHQDEEAEQESGPDVPWHAALSSKLPGGGGQEMDERPVSEKLGFYQNPADNGWVHKPAYTIPELKQARCPDEVIERLGGKDHEKEVPAENSGFFGRMSSNFTKMTSQIQDIGKEPAVGLPASFPFQPGSYQVLFPGTVTATSDINSEQLDAKLEVRNKLNILEVKIEANRKIRGRIEDPVAGWVTIADQGSSPLFPMLIKGEIPAPKARYKITYDKTAVTTERQIMSEKRGEIPAGKIVTVHQVMSVKDADGNERIRGKIRRPLPGWITLAYPAQGFTWAEVAKEEELGEYDKKLSRADFAEIYKQLSLLVQSGALDDDEEMEVYDMISQEDPKVVAAYRRYQKNPDLEKFALDIKPDNSPPMTPENEEEEYGQPEEPYHDPEQHGDIIQQEHEPHSQRPPLGPAPYTHPRWSANQQQPQYADYPPQQQAYGDYPPQQQPYGDYPPQQQPYGAAPAYPPMPYAPAPQQYPPGIPAPYVPPQPQPYPGGYH